MYRFDLEKKGGEGVWSKTNNRRMEKEELEKSIARKWAIIADGEGWKPTRMHVIIF